MYELSQHVIDMARDELWFNPHNDRQVTLKPARLTNPVGTSGTLTLRHSSIPLPDVVKRWVVYELGTIDPSTYGMEELSPIWESLDTIVTRFGVQLTVHMNKRILPLSTIYIRRGLNRNTLLAVDSGANIQHLRDNHPLYFRAYSNRWDYVTNAPSPDHIRTTDAIIATPDDLTNILNIQATTVVGNLFTYHNGYYVSSISAADVNAGDVVSIVNDRYGRGYIDMPISGLPTYISTLDNRAKVLVSMPVESNPLAVEPADELEIYLCTVVDGVNGNTHVKGVYYDVIANSDVRMVTHRDTGLDSRKIDAMRHEHTWLEAGSHTFLRVFYRTHENHNRRVVDGAYLLDLFRVSDDYILSMLAGTGGYDRWRCAELEKSNAVLWQTRSSSELTITNVKGVLSRPAIEELLAVGVLTDTTLTLPYSMRLGGRVLCYDSTGKLSNVLKVSKDSQGARIALPPAIFNVECIPGTFIDDGFEVDEPLYGGEVANWFNEAYYYKVQGDTPWTRAAVGMDYDIDTSTNAVNWSSAHAAHGKMRRTAEFATHNRVTVNIGTIYYGIPTFKGTTPVTEVGYARCDVYINNHPLTVGIDYYVQDNMVYIVNKEYYKDTASSTVTVDIFQWGIQSSADEEPITGYILHRKAEPTVDEGLFIENRNRTVVVDGGYRRVGELGVKELPRALSADDIREGAPWAAVARPGVLGTEALRLFISDDDYPDVVSKAVYNNIIPEENNGVVAIPRKHVIFSPFVKKLIVRIAAGLMDVESSGSTSAAVTILMESLLPEMVKDVGYKNIDNWMVDIHPICDTTSVTLTVGQYAFLKEMNKVYFKERITFNTHITIA